MNKIASVENILKELFCEHAYDDIVYKRCAEMIVRKLETGSVVSQKHTNICDKSEAEPTSKIGQRLKDIKANLPPPIVGKLFWRASPLVDD